jgi:ABC-type sulfate transport system permease component
VTDAAFAASSRRISFAARFGASPAQIAALAFVALFLAAFLVVPIVRVIFVAFTDRDGSLTLVNFQDFLATGLLREAFWNSIYVAAMTVALASLIAVPLATILTRFRFRGAALLPTLGVIPLVMPPFVGAVAMQLIYGRNGSINLLLNEWLGFRIPFMEGLNGVIFVEALHYFPSSCSTSRHRSPTSIPRWRNRHRTLARMASRCSGASCFRSRCRAMWRARRSSSSRCSTILRPRFCLTSPRCWPRRPISRLHPSESRTPWAT